MHKLLPGSREQNSLRDRIEFFRCPTANIGYLKTFKCASTFYNGLLAANGWQRQCYTDINWSTDHVFSFMSDPYIRHIKGMAEDIQGAAIEKFLLNNLGPAFWESIPWFGIHSLPISILLKDAADRINWIPMGAVEQSGEELLTLLLNQFGVSLDWGIDVYRNESDSYEKELFNKILDMSRNKISNFKMYCRDYELYEQALIKHGVTARNNN